MGKNLWILIRKGIEKQTVKRHIHKVNEICFEQSHVNNNVYYFINSWTSVNLLLTLHLFVLIMQILVNIICPMQNVYFWNMIDKKTQSSNFWQKGYQGKVLVFVTATPHTISTATQTGEQISSLLSSNKNFFP